MRYLTQERNGGSPNPASRFVMRGIVLGGITLVLAVMHVWLNIERVDLAYRYRAIEDEIQNKAALVNKLQLERENLVSPYRLKEMSNSLGLQPAQPGQIRNLALMAGEVGATAP